MLADKLDLSFYIFISLFQVFGQKIKDFFRFTFLYISYGQRIMQYLICFNLHISSILLFKKSVYYLSANIFERDRAIWLVLSIERSKLMTSSKVKFSTQQHTVEKGFLLIDLKRILIVLLYNIYSIYRIYIYIQMHI